MTLRLVHDHTIPFITKYTLQCTPPPQVCCTFVPATGIYAIRKQTMVLASVVDPDPGSGAFLTSGSGIGFFLIPGPKS